MAVKKIKNPTKAPESKNPEPKETEPLRPVDFRLVKKPGGEYVLYGYSLQSKAWVELPTTFL